MLGHQVPVAVLRINNKDESELPWIKAWIPCVFLSALSFLPDLDLPSVCGAQSSFRSSQTAFQIHLWLSRFLD